MLPARSLYLQPLILSDRAGRPPLSRLPLHGRAIRGLYCYHKVGTMSPYTHQAHVGDCGQWIYETKKKYKRPENAVEDMPFSNVSIAKSGL